MSGEMDFSSRYYTMVCQAQEKFVARLGSDLDAMSSDLKIAAETSEGTPLDALGRLHYRLHEITGSAGMLGLKDIHSGGRKALNLVEHAVDGKRPLDNDEGRAVSSFLSDLSGHIQNSMAEK